MSSWKVEDGSPVGDAAFQSNLDMLMLEADLAARPDQQHVPCLAGRHLPGLLDRHLAEEPAGRSPQSA
ncbi:hypothetical protein CJD44_32690 [Streptomyces sp. alain-838]|nr:hypothetical protein CJD44_32690 [Streptomyces sp. alain-838]